MKLSHIAMLLVAAVVVTVATSDDQLLRGNERFLGSKNDFEKLKVKYQPDEDPKCWLKYQLKGEAQVEVEFDDDEIKVDDDKGKVTCVKKDQSPDAGLELPLNEDLVLKDAEWVGEAVRDADVRWKKDDKKKKKLEVAIKRFTDWGAFYDEDGDPKCKLEYKFSSIKTKIKFEDSQVSVDDDKVTCKINDVEGLLPEGLKWFEKDIPNDDVECVDCVVKDADVSWNKGDPLKLVIKTEPDDDEVVWEAYYNPKRPSDKPRCWLQYTVGDKKPVKVRFDNDKVTVDGDKVTCRAKNVSPKRGLDRYLPVFENIPNDNVVWKDKDVKRAKVTWDLKNRVKLVIKKEPDDDDDDDVVWNAYYNPNRSNDRQCWLEYTVGDKKTVRVRFEDDKVTVDGDKVTCKKHNVDPKRGLELPVEEDIPNSNVVWVGDDVKDADVEWNEDGLLKLKLKRQKTKR